MQEDTKNERKLSGRLKTAIKLLAACAITVSLVLSIALYYVGGAYAEEDASSSTVETEEGIDIGGSIKIIGTYPGSKWMAYKVLDCTVNPDGTISNPSLSHQWVDDDKIFSRITEIVGTGEVDDKVAKVLLDAEYENSEEHTELLDAMYEECIIRRSVTSDATVINAVKSAGIIDSEIVGIEDEGVYAIMCDMSNGIYSKSKTLPEKTPAIVVFKKGETVTVYSQNATPMFTKEVYEENESEEPWGESNSVEVNKPFRTRAVFRLPSNFTDYGEYPVEFIDYFDDEPFELVFDENNTFDVYLNDSLIEDEKYNLEIMGGQMRLLISDDVIKEELDKKPMMPAAMTITVEYSIKLTESCVVNGGGNNDELIASYHDNKEDMDSFTETSASSKTMTYGFVINTVDKDGKGISNVDFDMFKDAECTVPVDTESSGVVKTVGHDGVRFDYLDDGEYYIQEKTEGNNASALLLSKPIKITLDDDVENPITASAMSSDDSNKVGNIVIDDDGLPTVKFIGEQTGKSDFMAIAIPLMWVLFISLIAALVVRMRLRQASANDRVYKTVKLSNGEYNHRDYYRRWGGVGGKFYNDGLHDEEPWEYKNGNFKYYE